jgi:transcription factor CP2-like protein
MAGNSELSNSAWRLEDLKELEHPLNYDIASGFSDLEISLGKDVHGAYNMSDVLSLPLFNEAHDPAPNEVGGSIHTTEANPSPPSRTLPANRPSNTAPVPIDRVKQEKDKPEDKLVVVLLAQTAFGTKVADESVTYLNKGQAYEFKLFTTDGEPKDNLYRSVIRLCFYERRYQFSEQEQILSWQLEHPNERMLQLDRAGCYGVSNVVQEEEKVNVISFFWTSVQEAIVSVKVNCLSTEFSARKHGGEKGVPLQLMVDTYTVDSSASKETHIHRTYCQVKVFKDKGAERKHKMDQQRLGKLGQEDMAKYKPAYQITLLKEVPVPNTRNISVFGMEPSRSVPVPTTLSSTPPKFSNTNTTLPTPVTSSVAPSVDRNHTHHTHHTHHTNTQKHSHSSNNGPIIVDRKPLLPSASHLETRQWLHNNRFGQFLSMFANYSADDLLRMSRKDLIEICGTGEGIRLYNLLRMRPKLTLYIAREGDSLYQAIFLDNSTVVELAENLCMRFNVQQSSVHSIARICSNGIAVALDDNFISRLEDESAFLLITIPIEGSNQYRMILKDSPVGSDLLQNCME